MSFFPLTLAQKDIYFDQIRSPESPMYNVGGYFHLVDIDVAKLTDVHRMAIASEDALGLRVTTDGQAVKQYLSTDRNLLLPVVDFSQHQDAQNAALQWLTTFFETPMALHDTELFKACLLKIDQHVVWYTLCTHHIALDGSSFANLARRMCQMYNADQSLVSFTGEWPKVAMADQDYLNSAKYQRDQHYWQQQQLNFEPLLPAHYQQQFTQHSNVSSRRVVASVSAAKMQALTALVQRHKVNLSHVFLALLACYFSRAYGKSTVVFGVPFHNRKNHQQKQMVGSFSSVSLMSIETPAQLTFVELMQTIALTQKQNFRHQRYPASHLLNQQNVDNGAMSTYDVGFSYLNLAHTFEFDGKPGQLNRVSNNHQTKPLMVTVWSQGEDADGQIQLDFNAAYFNQAEGQLLAARFSYLIDQLLSQPDITIGQLQIMPAQERQKLLYRWNTSAASDRCADTAQTVQQLFEAQVSKTPDRPALTYASEQLSYRQLNRRVNQLAHRLFSHYGRQPLAADTFVALYCDRSLETVISILAVLKAGGAYVPISPDYPDERIRFILQDTQTPLLISEKKYQPKLATLLSQWQLDSSVNCTVVIADQVINQADLISSNPPCVSKAADLAYALYTSGTTGQPKGVMMAQGALTQFIASATAVLSVKAVSTLSLTQYTFDIFGLEYAAPLLSGGQLILSQPERAAEDFNAHHPQLNFLQQTPSMWPIFLEKVDQAALADIEIMVGGEQGSWSLYEQLNGLFKAVYQVYGPTESCIWSAYIQYQQGDHQVIGQPFAGEQLYVLDDACQPVPSGVAGELYIGGIGLARGYLNQPELSAERFIDLPLLPDGENTRVYKSGDMVRWLCPDNSDSAGRLEFIGRIDNQVKIRGHRIELGEIDHALSQLTMVKAAVTVVHQSPLAEQQLIAYVTLSKSSLSTLDSLSATLRQALAPLLPDYMIPALFITLDNLPLSSHGKVDRKALPAPDFSQMQADYVPPRDPIEKTICDTWAQMLGLAQVGVHDNFFSLGGHSVLAMKVIGELEQQLARVIPLGVLFSHHTPALLAAHIEGLAAQSHDLPKISDNMGILPAQLSYAQQSLWMVSQLNGASDHYNMSLSIRLQGSINAQIIAQVLLDIVTRHQVLRTLYLTSDQGEPELKVLDGSAFALTLVALSTSGQSLLQWVESQASKPFDLTQDLPFRATLLKVADDEQVLTITVHHIAADAWSVDLLSREFEQGYNRLTANNTSELSALGALGEVKPAESTVQYSDYAYWQRRWVKTAQMTTQLDYWQRQLAQLPLVHNLPLDQLRPLTLGFVGHTVRSQIAPAEVEAFKRFCQQQQVTVFMGVYSVLSLLLARHSGEQDMVIGTPVANREQLEVSQLVGFFTNTLVLRNTVEPQQDFTALLNSSKKVVLDAYRYQQVPFERVLDALDVTRSLSYSPLFQIMVNFHYDEMSAPALNGIETSIIECPDSVAKFDLTLHVRFSEQGMMLGWEYNVQLWHQDTIKTLAAHFSYLFTQVIASPEQCLSQLPFEAAQPHTHTQTEHELKEPDHYPCLHTLFEQQASVNAAQIAMIAEGREVSYGQLNAMSNRLAHGIIAHNHGDYNGNSDGNSSHIVVMVENAIVQAAAILAVLKAGAVVVPLSVDLPQKRIDSVIADARPVLLISDQDTPLSLPTIEVNTLIGEHEALSPWQQYASENPHQQVNDEASAYIVYTSGSSGAPKGILQSHRSFSQFLAWQSRTFGLVKDARMAHWAPIHYDASLCELLGALCFGATVCSADAAAKADIFSAIKWLKQTRVSVAQFVPSYFQYLFQAMCQAVQNAAPVDWGSLTTIMLAGEKISPTLVQQWFAINGAKPALHNLYGPSETVLATHHQITPADAERRFISAGTAIEGRQILLLDEGQKSCAKLTTGEIYIRSDFLTQGYLQRPEEMAASYINNPLTDKATERVYRTGDLGRLWADGRLEIIGRKDGLIKIHGNRVELDEIAVVLASHEQVTAAVVDYFADINGGLLWAYVVRDNRLTNRQNNIDNRLNDYLRQRLPAYMLPQGFTLLDALPKTQTGKIDRGSLPKPAQPSTLISIGSVDSENIDIAAFNPLEQSVAVIWQQVLPDTVFGRHDNFFSLGGNSLATFKKQLLLKQKLGIEVPIVMFFQYPTIDLFCAKLQSLDNLAEPTAQPLASSPRLQQRKNRRDMATSRGRQRSQQARNMRPQP